MTFAARATSLRRHAAGTALDATRTAMGIDAKSPISCRAASSLNTAAASASPSAPRVRNRIVSAAAGPRRITPTSPSIASGRVVTSATTTLP